MKEVRVKLGNEELIIGTGKLAKQADGAVTVQYGDTLVLVTACCSKSAREGMSFFPLTVEYQEKFFAAGKIPGGFFKREGRPTQKSTLTSRMIDRPIRPLFPEGMKNEVQVIVTVLSHDGENDADILGIIGTSVALTISDIPFDGPIAGARVGYINGEFVLNPTFTQLEESEFEVIMVVKEEGIVMLEAGASEVSEDKLVEAIQFGHEQLKPVIELQKELQKEVGKTKREDCTFVEIDTELYEKLKGSYADKLIESHLKPTKAERSDSMTNLKAEIIETEDPEGENGLAGELGTIMEKLEYEVIRGYMLKNMKRVDGRGFDEIRQLTSEVNVLPLTHGCGLFTRGETQALAVITLGTKADEQRIDALEGESTNAFMLHYNFPSFSVGETRPMRGPGRREIGHGALAAKALEAVLPAHEDFPYTIRLVSEILESNGSSSMATVCAGSLGLMASGVPTKAPVSGIAMGLLTDGKDYMILTDIAGVEDHYGDMDFKVAGTKDGITAVQMDLKVAGISYDIIKEGFEKAKIARLSILENMNQTISAPSEEVAPSAPRIVTVMVAQDKIREVIGPGGKIIKGIIAETGADVNIEDDGSCQIASNNKESLDTAVQMVKDIIAEPEIGKIYDAKVTKLMNFGAFCEYMPGREGLVHVSEVADGFVKEVADHLKEGDAVKVKLIGVDDQKRVKLSIKQATPKDASKDESKEENQEQE